MNLPYFLKYWDVWLAFNDWKLSGLFELFSITEPNENVKNMSIWAVLFELHKYVYYVL